MTLWRIVDQVTSSGSPAAKAASLMGYFHPSLSHALPLLRWDVVAGERTGGGVVTVDSSAARVSDPLSKSRHRHQAPCVGPTRQVGSLHDMVSVDAAVQRLSAEVACFGQQDQRGGLPAWLPIRRGARADRSAIQQPGTARNAMNCARSRLHCIQPPGAAPQPQSRPEAADGRGDEKHR